MVERTRGRVERALDRTVHGGTWVMGKLAEKMDKHSMKMNDSVLIYPLLSTAEAVLFVAVGVGTGVVKAAERTVAFGSNVRARVRNRSSRSQTPNA